MGLGDFAGRMGRPKGSRGKVSPAPGRTLHMWGQRCPRVCKGCLSHAPGGLTRHPQHRVKGLRPCAARPAPRAPPSPRGYRIAGMPTRLLLSCLASPPSQWVNLGVRSIICGFILYRPPVLVHKIFRNSCGLRCLLGIKIPQLQSCKAGQPLFQRTWFILHIWICK